MRSRAAALLLAATVAGCSTASEIADVGADAPAIDAAHPIDASDAARADAARDDARHDAGTTMDAGADAGADTTPSDAGADVGPDAATCDPGALPTVRAYFEAEYTAVCGYYARCVPGFVFFGGAPSCEELYAARYEGTVDAMQALVDGGRTRFDPIAAASCVARLACAECGGFEDAVFSCVPSAVLAGTLADGSPCTSDIECSGGYCDDPMGCGNSGTCQRRPVEGEACTSGSIPCALPARCSSGVCGTLHLSAPGDPCPTGSCDGEAQCWGGTCHNPFDAMHLALGDACMTYGPDQCSIGLVCPSAGGTCEATRLALGAPCARASPDPCALGGYCDGTTCVALPTAGQPCAGFSCAVGFSCSCPTDAGCTTFECIAMHHLGEACTANVSCWSGSCVARTCVAHDVCD